MSMVHDLKTKAKHRGLSPWGLIGKIGRLERQANEMTCQLIALTTEVETGKAEIAALQEQRNQLAEQFDTRAMDHTDTITRIDARHTETVEGMQAEIAELKHRLEVGVLAEAVVTKTQPMPVADRFNTGPVVRLGRSPLADDTTQSMRAIRLPSWAKTEAEVA